MDRKRWKQIDDVLEQALDLEPVDRANSLSRMCAGDDELRRRVEALLERDREVEHFLETPALECLEGQIGDDFVTLTPGQQIGHYTVKSRIGAGGMGEVWKARDERLNRDVAIKVLPPEFSSDAERVRRFEQEAYTISRLNHPNIITIHDIVNLADEPGDLHFIVTELIEGYTLRERLKGPRIGWRESVLIAAQIADALNAVHVVEIIHRDIKPENVMIEAGGRVKLLDFGIAKLSSVSASNVDIDQSASRPGGIQTRLGARPGTLKYMSPEQARQEPLDVRTDVFSLGLVLYEMIAGRHPYGDKSSEEVITALKSEDEIPSISEANDAIPAALDRIVTKALRKRREERYSSGGEMLVDLERLKSLIEVGGGEKGERLLRAQNADQLLTQFVVFHEADRKTRIPLSALWTIRRFAGLQHGRLERELINKSLISGFAKAISWVLLVIAVTMIVAAWMSVTDIWEERILRDGHTAAVRQAVFSPDGKLLVSVSEDKRVIVWDFERRERLATLDGHKSEVIAVSFAPDGARFATMSRDGILIVWDAARREKIGEWQEHQATDEGIAFSPDGRLIASVGHGGNHTVVRETGRWDKVRELRDVDSRNVIFSPSGHQLMGSQGRIVDPATGRQIAGGFSDGENWVALSPDAARIAAINSAGEVSFYELARRGDLSERKLLRRELAHHDHGRAIEFSPDGRLVASGAEHVVLWNAATLKREAVLEYTSIVWGLAFSPDGRRLVSTHGDGSILVWDMATRTRAANFNEHSGPVRAVAFAGDGKRIVSASEDQSIIVWNTETGRKDAVLSGHESRINGVAFSRGSQWIASADQGRAVALWDVASRQIEWKVTDADSNGYCVAISPDGRWVASTSGVYERATGRQVLKLLDQMSKTSNRWGRAYGVAFSADGRQLVCATDAGFVLLWDVEHWQMIAQQRLTGTHQISVSFAPDGKTLVTGEDEGALRLWRVDPLEQIAVIGKHDARIKSVAFSPDGREVASASDDKTIRLWDVGSRKLITSIGTHTSPVLSVAFSPDGKQLISGEHDGSARLYTRHRTLWGRKMD